jgi:hypothetical protein
LSTAKTTVTQATNNKKRKLIEEKCYWNQPGPDNIIMELLKWLNKENRQAMLLYFNHWWRNKDAPKELFKARVVPIFKKGDTDLAENYRPISLLNSFYKVYMILIRIRIEAAVEERITKTQYGFRQSRSTAHAIYIIRRIQDYAEQKGVAMNLALLDWEKAFDKVKHDKLYDALRKVGLSTHFVDVIKNCYTEPTFYVKDIYGESKLKRKSSGIRQGCPLSPYLFLLVMTCIDEDINRGKSNHVVNARIPNLDYDAVYYADDTILFSISTRAVNELIRLTEKYFKQYGLKLNRATCNIINMNNQGNIMFADGTQLNNVTEATYLGNELNVEANIAHEITNKIQETRRIWMKLQLFWKDNNANRKWKIIIYDAIIRSKLLYGMETIHLTKAMCKQNRCFSFKRPKENTGS